MLLTQSFVCWPVMGAETDAEKPASSAPANVVPPRADGPVYVLQLNDEQLGGAISSWNLAYIKRSIERAKADGALLFLIEITTDGGRVDIVRDMSLVLCNIEGLRTAAYIKDKAISAGSLVAISCDDIYIKPGSVIGSALPIYLTDSGPKVAEKMIRALAVHWREIARKKGHPPALAEAMVDPDVEVVECLIDGKNEIMTRNDFEKLKRSKKDRRISETPRSPLIAKGRILDFGPDECIEHGLALAKPANRTKLLKLAKLENSPVIELKLSWQEKLAQFCSSGIVVGLLLAIAMLALYVEMNKPTGLGAAVFLTALGTFFWASNVAGSAGGLCIFLFLLGLALLLVEIFFIPGFGVAGICGLVLMAAGIIGARIPPGFFGPSRKFITPALWWDYITSAIGPLAFGFLGGTILILLLMRFFPKLPFFRQLIVKSDLSAAMVSVAGNLGVASSDQLLGLQGRTTTKLRPGGSAMFGSKLLDVVADGEFLEKNTPVKIIAVNSNRIVVSREQDS